MATYKDKKIMKIISQFEATSGQKYEINGIDLELAVFFYREPLETFTVMATSDYRIVEEGGNVYLVINNSAITSVAESYQIAYDISLASSKYEIAFNPDINTLKDKYNQLVDDTHMLFDYIRKQALISDDSLMEIILPQLDTGEVWVKADDGWKGFNVGDIEQNLKDFWARFYAETDRVLAEIKAEGAAQVKNVQDASAQTYSLVERQWKMYSIVTGANRYLSGNVLDVRDNLLLDREVNGKALEDRATLTLRREYNGGRLEDRNLSQDLVIDLGEAGGGA